MKIEKKKRDQRDAFPGKLQKCHKGYMLWTAEHRKWVLDNRMRISMKEMARLLGVSYSVIYRFLRECSNGTVRVETQFITEPFPGSIREMLGDWSTDKLTLNQEQQDWISRWMECRCKVTVAEHMGISRFTLIRICKLYGLGGYQQEPRSRLVRHRSQTHRQDYAIKTAEPAPIPQPRTFHIPSDPTACAKGACWLFNQKLCRGTKNKCNALF